MIYQALTIDAGEHNLNNPAYTGGEKSDRPAASIRSFASSIISSRRQTNNRFNRTMMPTILSLLLLGSTSTLAQSDDDELCSCSPREYYFKLDLSATCPDLPPPFPPNDVFGAGVKDYTCTIGPEPVPGEKKVAGEPRSALPFTSGEDVRKLLDESLGFNDNPRTDDFVIPEIIDPEPVVIDSIQFFEVDPDFNVINQDPTYVRDVEFVDGDVFNYTSISDLMTSSIDKENYSVPGGINMVLRGYNAAGERVRNVFTITFTNECDVPTFEAGDEIGWVIFVSTECCLSLHPQ